MSASAEETPTEVKPQVAQDSPGDSTCLLLIQSCSVSLTPSMECQLALPSPKGKDRDPPRNPPPLANRKRNRQLRKPLSVNRESTNLPTSRSWLLSSNASSPKATTKMPLPSPSSLGLTRGCSGWYAFGFDTVSMFRTTSPTGANRLLLPTRTVLEQHFPQEGIEDHPVRVVLEADYRLSN
jgi:hypothetical protein